jgi:DNA-binding NarL/FixJ family response regulator
VKILIVEDSPQIRKNLRRFISDNDEMLILNEAENSDSGINLIKTTKPDIIILDVELKDSSGFDILRFAKSSELTNNPLVIMFSNFISYKEKALNEKADYFFDKTNELDKLLDTIEKVIKSKSAM